MTVQITNAKIHLWATGLPGNPTHRPVTDFTAEEAVGLLDEDGVDAAVIHPPEWNPGSTELSRKAVQDYPRRFRSWDRCRWTSPPREDTSRVWRQQPGMLGLRCSFLSDVRQWLADGTIDRLWAETEKAGVPIHVIATESLAGIRDIAERHPDRRPKLSERMPVTPRSSSRRRKRTAS